MKYLKIPYDLRCGSYCNFDWDIDSIDNRPEDWPCNSCRVDNDMYEPAEGVEIIED